MSSLSQNKKEQINKNQQKTSIKKVVGGIAALVIVAVISIVGTLAFLNQHDEKTNTFTGSNSIKLELEEPHWNVGEYNHDAIDDPNGTSTTPAPTVKNLASPNPLRYSPNSTYLKDPTLCNTTGIDNENEWVALLVSYDIPSESVDAGGTVTYTSNYVDYATFTKKYTSDAQKGQGDPNGGVIEPIVFNATDENGGISTNTANGAQNFWIKLTDNEYKTTANNNTNAKYDIFIYKYPLKGDVNITSTTTNFLGNAIVGVDEDNLGEKTVPLFNEIKTITQDQLVLNGYDPSTRLPKFEIKIIGAAINIPDEYTTIEEIPSNKTGRDADIVKDIRNELISILVKNAP